MRPNPYDDPAFFAAYAGLERSQHGLAGAAEWPTLRGLLPDVAGRRIVDLGCGYGWFCRWARAQGAAEVQGIDGSARMLARAAEWPADPGIHYRCEDLERLTLPERSVELAFSSLTLHYVAALPRLLEAVARALVPGGRLVFSVEHPIYTAPRRPRWIEGEGGGKAWPVEAYLAEGRREVEWLGCVVTKQHRTLAGWINALATSGLAVSRVEEFGPSAQQVAERPEWAAERERPMFLLVRADRAAPR